MTILLAFLSSDKSLFLVFLISELNSDLSKNSYETGLKVASMHGLVLDLVNSRLLIS